MFRILENQQGSAIAEYVILLCFVVIAILVCLAMFEQGGIDANDITTAAKESVENAKDVLEEVDWQEEIEQAEDMKDEIKYNVCASLCKADYDAGVNNVVQYNNCLGNCSQ